MKEFRNDAHFSVGKYIRDSPCEHALSHFLIIHAQISNKARCTVKPV